METIEQTALQETTNRSINKIDKIIVILHKHFSTITNTLCERFNNNNIGLSVSSIELATSAIPILLRKVCDDIYSFKTDDVRINLQHLLKNIEITQALIIGLIISNSPLFTHAEIYDLAEIDDIRMKYLSINYNFIANNPRT
jgi:hypothetical protein